jgi:zinc protease
MMTLKTKGTMRTPAILRTTPSTIRLTFALLPILLFTLASNAQSTAAKPASTPNSTPAAQPWKRIAIPPLHAFKPVQPKRIELANGLVIFLQEDHELPFINGTILIRGGERDEPDAKLGLVSLYGGTWRTSGTATVDGDKLDDQLEAKAASIETAGLSSRSSSNIPASRGATTMLPASPSARPYKLPTAQIIPMPARSNTRPSAPLRSTT